MHIRLICVGQRMPGWVAEGYGEYARRLPAACALSLVEIPLRKRNKGADWRRFQAEEGAQMLAAIPAQAQVVALDERGRNWDSIQLSEQLGTWLRSGHDLALLVGGPEGLAPACLERAGQTWSLSKLTLPHMLVRVIVAEQLYRAWSVLNQHPYHRA